MTADVWRDLSFDPQTWLRPAARPVAWHPQWSRSRPFAVSALLLVLGAGCAWWARPPATTPTLRQVANAGPDLAQRSLVLAGQADLLAALEADGIDRRVAEAAVTAARKGMASSGEIRAALTLVTGPRPRLLQLKILNPDGSGVVVLATARGFSGERVPANLQSRIVVRRGRMDAESFYSSAVAAGVDDSLIADFAKALAFDFDFQRDVRPGDTFEAAFEQRIDASGQPVGAPRLLYASLTNATKSAAVYRFAPPGGETGWYDSSGRSVVRALMRTPVDGARVSSTFGMRVHPVLGFQKMHKGIDFAAVTGTPVFASGDGVIESAVPSATAGNWIRLRHDNGWETVYMHLNRFSPGIAGSGARVHQGQEIGEVGTTGRSTGPHLHYELHIDGQPVDPTQVDTGGGTTLSGHALVAFGRERDRIDVSRAGETTGSAGR